MAYVHSLGEAERFPEEASITKGGGPSAFPADGNSGHAEACEWGVGVVVLCHWAAGFDSKWAGGVGKLKWRKSCSKFQRLERRPSDFDFCSCQDYVPTCKHTNCYQQVKAALWIRKGMGLVFLSPWSSGQLPGVQKIRDSQR